MVEDATAYIGEALVGNRQIVALSNSATSYDQIEGERFFSLPAPPIAARAADIDPATDMVVQALQLAARVHVAGSDPLALQAALKVCSEWLSCTGVLSQLADGAPLDADALEVLAGRVSHCAAYGRYACGGGPGDPLGRTRCAALAAHLHETAVEARNALHAMFFDRLPPTWIVDRGARVRDNNAPAKTISTDSKALTVIDGVLTPAVPGGGARLRRALTDLNHEARFSWPGSNGNETTLLLRPLPAGACVAVTLLPEPPTAEQLATVLAQCLKLTQRQSELAAHLLTGLSLSDAARTMDISRDTANVHLDGLLRRTGASSRKALLVILRRAVIR
jgi:DNA-binding CsgD family transcriptional regulator